MKGNGSSAQARYLALLRIMRSADTLWESSRLFFARWELSPSQFNVLNLLAGEPGGLSQAELGRQLITHRSNVTGLVDRLERRQLVKRRNVVGDRRAYRVVLTARGQRLWRRVVPGYNAAANRIWGRLSSRRAIRLAEDLSGLSHNAERLATNQSH